MAGKMRIGFLGHQGDGAKVAQRPADEPDPSQASSLVSFPLAASDRRQWYLGAGPPPVFLKRPSLMIMISRHTGRYGENAKPHMTKRKRY